MDKKSKNKKKAQKKQESEEEEFDESQQSYNEEEEDEEDEEGENNLSGFIDDDENEESGSEINERNLHLNEDIFKKKEKEKANLSQEEENEDEKEEEEDIKPEIKKKKDSKNLHKNRQRNGKIKEEDENNEDSRNEKEDNDEEVKEEDLAKEEKSILDESDEENRKKKKKPKRKLKKAKDLDKKKQEMKKEAMGLLSGDEGEEESNEMDEEGKENDENDSNIKRRRENEDDDFIERPRRKNKSTNEEEDDFIDDKGREKMDIDEYEEIHKTATNVFDQEYITEEDKKIIETDYPERLLLRYNEDQLKNLSNELKKEQEWICDQLDKNYMESASMKKKIYSLLEFYKKDFLDVPFIVTYKTHIYEPELSKKEVYDIFELDKEYQKLNDLKQKVLENFQQLEKHLGVKIFRNMKEKYIDNAKSINTLKNMEEFINFSKEKFTAEENERALEENKKDPEKFRMQGPIKKSMVSICFSGRLHELVNEFCLNSNDIAYNIELIRNNENSSKLLSPPEPQSSLTDLLSKYKSDIFNSEIKVMENISKLIGLEMINHPYIKEYVYDHLEKNCYVSTTPTKEGEKILDVFHPSFRTKRIKDKPILLFEDDVFLDVIKNENMGLIVVKIFINEREDSSNEFKYIFKQAINSNNKELNIEQSGMGDSLGIKRENDFMGISNSLGGIQSQNYSSANKSEWSYLRESVIKAFFELITKQFIIDIKKKYKEKAENFVINQCSDKFYHMLMSGPYKRNPDDIFNIKTKKEKNKNKKSKEGELQNEKEDEEEKEEEEIQRRPSDRIFRDDELPKVMSFIYDQTKNVTHCVALNQNGEIIDEKTFNFVFQRPNRRKPSGNKGGEDVEEVFNSEQVKCQNLIEKHKPNLIVIGANDLKSRLVKDQIRTITDYLSKKKLTSNPWVTFGDLSIPTIYSNSQISDSDFPTYDMYIKQGISLGRYQQNPLQEILQLWKDDVSENYCLKIKLHPLQKFVDQPKLMEKLEVRAIEVVNAVGFDLNKAYEYQHLRNSLQFISGFGPRKAKNFIKNILIHGRPRSRRQLEQDKNYQITPKLAQSFLSFIKIKTDVTQNELIEGEEYDLLDMTRIRKEEYDFVKSFLASQEDGKKGKKKRNEKIDKNALIEEIFRDPKKLENFDFTKYIKDLLEKSNRKNDQQYESNLNFSMNFIKEELSNPFKDPRKERKDLDSTQIFYLLLGDENFKEGIITVAKVTRVSIDHVHCHLENGLNATVWWRDIFEESELNSETPTRLKEKMKEMFKPGYTFEARVKDIDFIGYKPDLIVKPSIMESHKNYIPEAEGLANFFQLTDDDRMNVPYILSHSQKNRKYQIRNIKYNKFQNISYTDCCNFLKNKEIGDCVFRPSSSGINNITLSYKFYKQIICHIDIVEEDKTPGESIGKKLRISSEAYHSLDEIYKRYVIPCSQLIKDSIKNRKFVQSETKAEFENKLKEDKKKTPKIINYNFTILKDYPGYIVLGYVPKNTPYYEYVKVKPKGLYFHNEYYQNLEDVCTYFKSEYGNERYRDFVRTATAPNVQYHKGLESGNNRREMDYMSEGRGLGLKEDNFNNYDDNNIHGGAIINNNRPETRTCRICQEKGHISKNCPLKNKNNNQGGGNNFRGDRGDRRGGNDRGGDRMGRDKYTGGKRNRDFDNRDGSAYRRDNNRGYDKSNNRQQSTFSFNNSGDNNVNWGGNSNDVRNDDDNWGNNDGLGNNNKNSDDGWGNNNTKEEKQENEDDAWGNENSGNNNW